MVGTSREGWKAHIPRACCLRSHSASTKSGLPLLDNVSRKLGTVSGTDVLRLVRHSVGDESYITRLTHHGRLALELIRDAITDIYRVYVRSKTGAMVPIRALAQAQLIQG